VGNTILFRRQAAANSTYLSGHRRVDTFVSTQGRGFLQGGVAIGIGLGRLLAAGYARAEKSRMELSPLGSMGIDHSRNMPGDTGLVRSAAVVLLLMAAGLFGEFLLCPISAMIKTDGGKDQRGVVIGAANWLSFVGIGAASGVIKLPTHFLHLSPGGISSGGALRHSEQRYCCG